MVGTTIGTSFKDKKYTFEDLEAQLGEKADQEILKDLKSYVEIDDPKCYHKNGSYRKTKVEICEEAKAAYGLWELLEWSTLIIHLWSTEKNNKLRQ